MVYFSRRNNKPSCKQKWRKNNVEHQRELNPQKTRNLTSNLIVLERVTEEGVVVVADQTTLADPKSKASTSGGSDRSSTSGSYSLEAAGSTDKDEELLEMKVRHLQPKCSPSASMHDS